MTTVVRDRHVLYQLAVQDAKRECDFMKRVFREKRGRFPRVLREDFCGTANICCRWARMSGKNVAVGVDLDAETLAWARAHNLGAMTPAQQQQVTLLEQDVRELTSPAPELVCAYNFSYFVFWTRGALRDYFASVRASIAEDGLFFLDIFGGCEAFEPNREETEHDGFCYIWELAEFNPIDHRATFHIHFTFPDTEPLSEAFTYEWRFWTIPEVRELLAEAGFSSSQVWWQDSDEEDEFTGTFSPCSRAENDSGWVSYIVASP